MKRALFALVFAFAQVAAAQELQFPELAADRGTLANGIPDLARRALAEFKDENPDTALATQFRLQLAAGQYDEAVVTVDAWTRQHKLLPNQHFDVQLLLEIYAKAKAWEIRERLDPADALAKAVTAVFARLDDATAVEAEWFLGSPVALYRDRFATLLESHKGKTDIALAPALELIRQYLNLEAATRIAPSLVDALAVDDRRRYQLEDLLIKTSEGVSLSAIVARKKDTSVRVPALFSLTIYTNPIWSRREAKLAVLHGYAGVIVDSRGKRLSPNVIQPWETEAQDTYAVIDWISRQPWSNGKVGMYGASYGGFAAWAAAKRPHPALKTIVPVSASFPGFGLPMQDNVFQFANYAWPFYVMNNKTLDEALYNDNKRWSVLAQKWYASGRPYREIDAIDGLPNPLLQKQLQHPTFDRYWQAQQPYRHDYSRISIPVLTMTGYFDDANAAAVDYLREHMKYNVRANHVLLIGPYGHSEAHRETKRTVVNGYTLDPIARFNGVELLYQWFDYVMREGPRPGLLKDRINYQTMGANEWRHVPSIEKMSDRTLKLYLSNEKSGNRFALASVKSDPAYLEQAVDFADRSTQMSLYSSDAVESKLDFGQVFEFVSSPFDAPVTVDGMMSGELKATINKKDMDVTLAFYEWMPDGRYFRLGYYLGRASYAHDATTRKLLTPGKLASIPFEHTPLVSRQLQKGSRLVVLLTVNKSAWSQVNHGTGKDVSDESAKDATEPLIVRWHNDSFVNFPISGKGHLDAGADWERDE